MAIQELEIEVIMTCRFGCGLGGLAPVVGSNNESEVKGGEIGWRDKVG